MPWISSGNSALMYTETSSGSETDVQTMESASLRVTM